MKRLKFKILSWLMALAVVLSGCSAALPSVSVESPAASEEMSVHFIDVGQGDSILVESGGHYLLVDAGENDQAATVTDYLSNQGVTRLDYVIGTHPHSDHIGGLDAVISEFEVGKVILPPVEHTTRTFEDVLDAVADKGLKLTKPVPGDSYTLGDASFTIIAPNGDYGDDLNNWSVGILLENGANRFVMCGDAEAKAEADIAGNGMDISADVLKVGHHGSRTSTSNEFLDRVNPSTAVIQCGAGNSYGHPHKETMTKLKERKIQVFRTDQDGTIIARSDGKNIRWETASGRTDRQTTETAAAKESAAASSYYVLNTNSKKFHLPGCSSVQQISDKNKAEWDGTRDDLISQGYAPCKQCNP